jgi:hypothetical protein
MIEKLEALLARVRTRAAEPRRRPEGTSAATPRGPHGVNATGAGPEGAFDRDVTAVRRGTLPKVAPVEPGSEGYDSGERFVVAQPAAPDRPAEVHQSAPQIDVAEAEVSSADTDEAPISSRRTVASEPEEHLAKMAFGTEEPQPPIHTPPPESGRLPAAPAAESDRGLTGVRDATPMLPRRMPEPVSRELVPEAIRPHLVPSDAVAELIARAQRFAPSTFVELLAASLDL